MNSNLAIEVKNLTKKFRYFMAVDDISFSGEMKRRLEIARGLLHQVFTIWRQTL